MRSLAIAALLCAAPAGAAGSPDAASPSFDCAKARRADERLVCETPDLAALDRLVADAYAAALRRAPAKADQIRRAQREWIARRSSCFSPREGERPDREDAAACLRRDYGRRLSELAGAEVPLPAGFRRRTIQWTDEARHVEVDIAYPALAPGAPGGAAFDAWSEKRARAWEARARELAADPEVARMAREGGMPSSVAVSFTVALATPRVVTVAFTGYEYTTGGAHGLPFRRAVTFDLRLGRPLAEGDLFLPGGKERALRLVARALRGYGDLEPAELPTAVSKAAGDLSAWTFRAEGVEVTLPVYSIVGYASGETPVWLTWDELRPELRPEAPLPPR